VDGQLCNTYSVKGTSMGQSHNDFKTTVCSKKWGHISYFMADIQLFTKLIYTANQQNGKQW